MADFNYSTVAEDTQLSNDIDDTQTTIGVDGTAGFPATPFTGVIDPGGAEEAVTVTAVVGLTLTVERGQDGTDNVSHTLGTTFRHMGIGRDLQLSRDHEEADADVHGLAGGDTVLGRTQSASVENKTISGSANTFQNVPQSAVTDLVGDQNTQDTRLDDAESDIATAQSNIGSVQSDLNDHKDDTSTHGVGEILGRTEAATVINKTLDGDDNTFENVPQEALQRGVLNMNGDGTDRSLAAGSERFRTTFNTSANVGGFSTGDNSAERILPFTGLYLVMQEARVTGTNNDSDDDFQLRIRKDGTAGNLDGEIITRAGGNMNTATQPEGYASQNDIIGPYPAGTRLKFTIANTTGGTITDVGNPEHKHAGLIYLGPA